MLTEQQLFDNIVNTSIVDAIIFILFITAGIYFFLQHINKLLDNSEQKPVAMSIMIFVYAVFLLYGVHLILNAEVNAHIKVAKITVQVNNYKGRLNNAY